FEVETLAHRVVRCQRQQHSNLPSPIPSLLPGSSMGAHWMAEPFEGDFTEVFEPEPLANAEFGNCVCHQNLFRLRVGAKPAGQLNRRSKEIVVLLDRFTCCGADPNLERTLRIRLRVLVQFTLNLNGAANRARS